MPERMTVNSAGRGLAAAVLDSLDLDRAVDLVREVCRIPSVLGEEGELAAFLAAFDCGFLFLIISVVVCHHALPLLNTKRLQDTKSVYVFFFLCRLHQPLVISSMSWSSTFFLIKR